MAYGNEQVQQMLLTLLEHMRVSNEIIHSESFVAATCYNCHTVHSREEVRWLTKKGRAVEVHNADGEVEKTIMVPLCKHCKTQLKYDVKLVGDGK
jgi:hypothetical protein